MLLLKYFGRQLDFRTAQVFPFPLCSSKGEIPLLKLYWKQKHSFPCLPFKTCKNALSLAGMRSLWAQPHSCEPCSRSARCWLHSHAANTQALCVSSQALYINSVLHSSTASFSPNYAVPSEVKWADHITQHFSPWKAAKPQPVRATQIRRHWELQKGVRSMLMWILRYLISAIYFNRHNNS